MFKAPKRKRPKVNRTTRARDESDDENDSTANAIASQQAQAVKRKKKRKRKTATTTANNLSFNIDDGNDIDVEVEHKVTKKSKHKKQKRKRNGVGMGFGGMSMHSTNDSGDEEGHGRDDGNETMDAEMTPKTGSGCYSKNELEKLKSQQKVYIAADKSQDDRQTPLPPPQEPPLTSSVPLPPLPTQPIPVPKPSVPEEEFISFDSSSKPCIVNGDDVLKYTGENDEDGDDKDDLGTHVLRNSGDKTNTQQNQQDILEGKHHSNDNGVDSVDGNGEDEEGRKWEEEIARRAGVSTQTGGNPSHSESSLHHDRDTPAPFEKKMGMQVVGQIKQTIGTTIDNLKQQDLDLESSIIRRKHDAQTAQEEATKQMDEIQKIGNNFEYYQKLRGELVDWIGALRHLSHKIKVIEQAKEELFHELGSKKVANRKEWEDEVVAVLTRRGWLDYVVGRQPEGDRDKDNSEGPKVDEFGRDIVSMEALARSKKRFERERRRSESRDRRSGRYDSGIETNVIVEYEDTDADISDDEIMDRGERSSALSDAVQVTIDELDEVYTSVKSLLSVFENWNEKQPSDFQQCYANLALVDFIAVLARAEFCKKIDFMCFSGEPESVVFENFEWSTALKDSNILKIDDGDHIWKSLKQVCTEVFKSYFHGAENQKNCGLFWAYDPFSKRQTISLTSFCKSIAQKMPGGDIQTVLVKIVYDYINKFVQDMAVPIVNQAAIPTEDHAEIELTEAYKFAGIGQLYRMKKVYTNILELWYPTLGNPLDLAKFCMNDILSYRFLPILNAIGIDSKSESSLKAKEIFSAMWESAMQAKLLENNDLMLSSAPFRAVARRLEITS